MTWREWSRAKVLQLCALGLALFWSAVALLLGGCQIVTGPCEACSIKIDRRLNIDGEIGAPAVTYESKPDAAEAIKAAASAAQAASR